MSATNRNDDASQPRPSRKRHAGRLAGARASYALLTLFGVIGVLAGGLVEEALRQMEPMEPAIPLAGLGQVIAVIFGVVLVLGILHLVSAIGIFLHKQWGRIIGILLAVLGTLFWVLGLVGSLQAPAEPDLVLPLAIAVAYAFTLFALIAGGHHFQRRWR